MRGVRPEHRRRGQRGSLGASRRAICGAGGFGLLIGLLLSVSAVVEPPRGEARPAGEVAGTAAGAGAGTAAGKAGVSAAAESAAAESAAAESAAAESAAAESPAAEPLPLALLRRHPRVAVALGVLLALVIADQLVLRLRPRWLLRLPDQGLPVPVGWDFDAQSPKVLPLGGWLFGPLKHRDRVLDAWVADHLPTVRRRFLEERPTVKQRRHHLDTLPVKVNETLETELTPERFRQLEGAVGGLVLISGEGGVGKTSLAVRIATWALAGELTARPVVPVLVEADLRGDESLLSRVRGTLAALSAPRVPEDGAPPLSLPLARALLERRRLLVILDHYSELSDESRRRLSPGADDFPAAWVLVTTRREEEESVAGKVVLHLRPQRLMADRLWPFFSAYLEELRKPEAWDDDLLDRAKARLREITAGLVDDSGGITVLLAKLYIDVVVAERRGAGVGVLPASVPALMLTYVRQINGAIPEAERQPRELVVRALQHLAQASEATLFRPRAVRREAALRALVRARAERHGMGAEAGGQPPRDGEPLLDYLVKRLLLVEETSDGEFVRLVLDPLADYLAALGWLRQLDREGDSAWDRFLAHTLPAVDSEAAVLARGFLRALYDSAVHAADRAVLGVEVAPERVARLAERAAIDPARLDRERQRRRQRRLIDDLAEADPAVRLQAIEELCRRRSRDGAVSEALGRVLSNADQEPALRQAAATALAALGGPEAARLLAAVAEASPPAATPPSAEAVALRRLALEGLGLVLAGWGGAGASPLAERQRLTRLLEERLRADALDLLVSDAAGWAEHDRRLPPLQGAARGLQLAVAPELPLLGAGPGRPVPMLTLSALREGEGLRIRTEVVTPAVWHLPLPELPGAEPQRLELVLVPGGTCAIGSPEGEEGRDVYTRFRQGCEGVNVEAPRTVRLKPFALARHPISQAQWQAVARLPEVSAPLPEQPGSHEAKGLWEARAQPGALPVSSVSWEQAQEWLRRLNRWLAERWGAWGGEGEAPELALPSESQWEAACRAGTATPFHLGDTLDASWANVDGTYTYGPGRLGPYRQRPVTAGAFGLVNRWGLAELHGQLLEWCADPWHRDPLAGAAGEALDGSPLEGLDPGLEGHVQQTYKLLRGGSWFSGPRDCRSACRLGYPPASIHTDVGFRVCCLPPGSLLGP